MSLDLFQQEGNERLTALPPVQNVDPGMFDGFVRGTGLATMKGFAKAARAVDLLGSVGPIVQDAFTGGTEAQDKYFAEHDAVFGRAVDYWTPRSNEIGMAGEVMGGLMSVLPQVIASPGLAVATTQLGTAEDLANVGVTTGKAQIVGAVQGLTLGTGIWMPILGKNLWQRAVIGGAGFNLAQGTVARGVSGAILEGTPAAEMFKAFDGEAMTLDVLMGLAFGGLVHYSPTQRAQGAKAWESIEGWARNLNPSDKAAIVTLREAQHLNLDSTPGKPVSDVDIEAHVNRMRASIDQLATDQPVNVEDIRVPRRTADIGEAPAEVRALFEQEQQLRQEWQDAENSRGDAMERNDQEAIATWDGELQRIATDLQDVSTRRTELWAAEELDTQPRFDPDPERTAQAEATMRDLAADAETIRAEDGIPPPPVEPPRVVQSVRRTIEEQLVQAGRPAEEATAGAAIWDAFYTTMAKRLGTSADELWQRFPLARITKELPGEEALKQGPNGDPVITVAGKDRPITNAEGKRIANDIEELKAFWNWFKDSKVTRDGKPLQLYHGTKADFAEFRRTKSGEFGPAIYLTDSPREAGEYGDGKGWGGPNGTQVMPVYASIKNPYTKGVDAFWREFGTGGTDAEGVAAAQAAGYDGIIVKRADRYYDNDAREFVDRGGELTHYVVFEPTQIKSAIGNRGTFDPKNPDILFQTGKDTWYRSALGEAITNLNMKQGDAKAWLQALKGLGSKGVKAEEVKWSGIEEWLQMQEGKITKEQVQDFLANNGVKVEEVMLGGQKDLSRSDADSAIAEDVAALRANEYDVVRDPQNPTKWGVIDPETGTVYTDPDETYQLLNDLPEERVDQIQRVLTHLNGSTEGNAPVKYGTYQLPGGENYRELLLTLPEPQKRVYKPDEIKVTMTPNGHWEATVDGHSTPVLRRAAQTEESARVIAAEIFNRREDKGNQGQQFQSSHFDQPNILAHVRFNERTDADGKKVLFIEEFQSDWAQKGKREGFKTDQRSTDDINAEIDGVMAELYSREEAAGRRRETASLSAHPDLATKYDALIAEMSARQKGTIPAAPFVGKTDAWVGLALKRMIAYAAQNGFDRVAWTRGEQQVERYTSALRKAVDVIEWKKTPEGVQLVGYKGKGGEREPSHGVGTQLGALRTIATDAIARNDDMGFDSTHEALQAVLAHEDWGQRWGDGLTPADFNALGNYRRRYMSDVADQRQKVVDTTEKEDALSDAIGKAMAEKIISDPSQTGTIEGEGIKIDSTGMAGFYDRIVPKVANEVLKKLGGGKVGEAALGKQEGKPFNRQDVEDAAAEYMAGHIDADEFREASGLDITDDAIDDALGGPSGGLTASQRRSMVRDFANEMREQSKGQKRSTQMAFDITPKMKEAVDGGLPLFQKTKGTERGYMSIGDEGRVIGLLEGADASTFVHESGHFFLDTMAAIGKEADTPPEVRADLNTALGWMGVKDPAKWPDMTLAEKRPYHEKFARGFEQYLRNGEAPSPELKGVFQRFRDWLVEIYKSAKSLNVKLNDDIRGVLNRMLADQTRNPSTEAPPAPAERTGSPPPPRSGGEAQAGAEVPLIDQPPIRTILQGIADNETGWAQIGGRLMDQSELGTGKPSFTTWIPKAEWWPDRPDKKMNGPQAQEAVRKALAGEKLKPIEQRMVDFMLTMADERSRGLDQVGGPEEYDALALNAYDEGLEPTTQNVVDVDLVARAAAIDEAAVERAALQYENDDAAFRGEMEMIIYEAERTQAAEAAGRSKAGEQAPAGGPEGQAYKPGDIVRNEADLIVQNNPDMPITVGTNPDGTPMTMTAKAFLDQARAEAQMNRDDIPLLEVAAQCLFGRS